MTVSDFRFLTNFLILLRLLLAYEMSRTEIWALRDMYRVLKPGGRFFCLEFSTPPTEWLRKIYDLYSFNVIPRMGGMLAGGQRKLSIFGRKHPQVS